MKKKIISLGREKFERFFNWAIQNSPIKPTSKICPPITQPLGEVSGIDQLLHDLSIPDPVQVIIKQLSVTDLFCQMLMLDPLFLGFNKEKLSPDTPVGSLLAGGGGGPGNLGDSWANFNSSKLLEQENFTIDSWAKYTEKNEKLAIKSLPDGQKIMPFYGVDNVHGASKSGGIIFPTNSLMGCIPEMDRESLLKKQGEYVAEMTKAAGLNMVFGPEVDITDPLVQAQKNHQIWGRTEECYSSQPSIAGEAGAAFIKGLQEKGVISVAKHFVGEGYSDKDQGTAVMTFTEIEDALAPFQKAIDAGTASIMLAYHSIKIVDNAGKTVIHELKCHDHAILVRYLRERMGFKGVLMSDFNGLDLLISKQAYFTDEKGKHSGWAPTFMDPYGYKMVLEKGINHGDLDIIMTDRLDVYLKSMKELYQEGKITLVRLLESAARIIQLKLNFGLIRSDEMARSPQMIEKEKIIALAKECIVRGTVLQKGSAPALCIPKDTPIIMGGDCDHMGRQCGGWTGDWQGLDQADIPVLNQQGATYFKALHESRPGMVSKLSDNLTSPDPKSIGIYVLSEKPTAEMFGDVSPDELKLSKQQLDEINLLQQKTTQLILIVSTGRKLNLHSVQDQSDVILFMGRPGPQGGPALCDFIDGQSVPSGTFHSAPSSSRD